MQPQAKTIIDLEKRFWKSIVDQDTDTALEMLCEPALMVGAHGAMKFGHEQYRKMAEEGSWVLSSYELSDMDVVFPNDSTAVITYHSRQTVTPRTAGKQMDGQTHDAVAGASYLRIGGSTLQFTRTPIERRGATGMIA
jgi:ketosteroid isomerase-like protein